MIHQHALYSILCYLKIILYLSLTYYFLFHYCFSVKIFLNQILNIDIAPLKKNINVAY